MMLRRAAGVLVAGLLLTFGAAIRVMAMPGATPWPELGGALLLLAVVGLSFRSRRVRDYLGVILEASLFLTAGWFIYLAALARFEPSSLIGLPAVYATLGVAYALSSAHRARTALFMVIAALGLVAGAIASPTPAPWLAIASVAVTGAVALVVIAALFAVHGRHLAARRHYESVIDQAEEGIFLLDVAESVVRRANPSFCRMSGWTIRELAETSPAEMFALEENGRAPDFRSVAEAGRVLDCLLRRQDGELIPVELRADRLDQGSRSLLSVVVKDVVARREYEERLKSVKQSLEEITRFKSSLLANMSHEVRTPLSSILGWAAVLNDELPERQRELVHLIENSGRRLLNTLNSMIELAHLHANTMNIRPALVDANEVVQSTVRGMEGLAREKGLRLDVELSAEPAWVRLDPRCLHRSLVHLLDNAIKFTSFGHVSVTVQRDQGHVRVSVEDTGAGIGEEFLPMIFDEFKQESAGLSRNHEGNGLGLPIARRLVEMAGGHIEVQSEQGRGSTFTISVVAVAAPAVHELHIEEHRFAQVS